MRTPFIAIVLLAFAGSAAAADLLKVGDRFPAWTLVDQSGATVTSASLSHKTYLLWFYPRAMTPGCTAEGRALRDRYASFQAKGVEVLGVSFDEPKDNAAFVAQENFPFRLLSDRDRVLATAVGAASSPTQGAASRISYLVGPDGAVLEVYGSVDPGRHADQVLGDLSTAP